MKLKASMILTLAIILIAAGTLNVVPLAEQLEQAGPKIDTLRFLTIRSPDAKNIAMQIRDMDVWTDMTRPGDIEGLFDAGKTVTARPGFNICYFGFNLRKPILEDLNFRYAMAHLLPKDDLIGTIYQYVATKIDTMCPPSLGVWNNPDVEGPDFDPGDPLTSPPWDGVQGSPTETAVGILLYGGYNFHDEGPTGSVGPEDWWDNGIDPLPTMELYSHLYSVAPTLAESAARLVQECNDIGLNNVQHLPYDFNQIMHNVFDLHDFDMYLTDDHYDWPCKYCTRCHSSQDVPGGSNAAGVNDPDLDALLETVMSSQICGPPPADPPPPEGILAFRTALEMLADPTRPCGFAYLPFFSRAEFAAQQPELAGVINSVDYGIQNQWTHMNMYWNTFDGNRPGTTEKLVIWNLDDEPGNLNPAAYPTFTPNCDEYPQPIWSIMDPIYDRLIETNPWTLNNEPWLATDWTVAIGTWPTPEGPAVMKVHFDLRDDVYWQDHDPDMGVNRPFTAEDCVFALNYTKENELPAYKPVWEKIVYVDKLGDYSFDIYTSEIVKGLVYDAAKTCTRFPSHIWQSIVDDPFTPENEILEYVPTDHPNPTSRFPDLTELVGTGPFVLTTHDPIMGYSDLSANRFYWLTTSEIENQLDQMFHRAGDVNFDGIIGALDLAYIALSYGATPVDPLWNSDADLNSDGVIDILDCVSLSTNFGETLEVSSALSSSSESNQIQAMMEKVHYSALEGSATETKVCADPEAIMDDTLDIGDFFTLDINITNVFDLVGFDFRLSFDPSILNAVTVVNGDFLLDDPPYTHHNKTNNAAGFVRLAVSRQLGKRVGVSGSGKLATVTFEVVGYTPGTNMTLIGQTKLAESHGLQVNHVTYNAFFNNTWITDVNRDGIVGVEDLLQICLAYGATPSDPRWNPDADITGPAGIPDGLVNIYDLTLLGKHYGRGL